MTPEMLFFILSIAGILGFFIFAMWQGKSAWKWMLQENNPDIHGVDYYMHVTFSVHPETLYTDTNGCFPPFAYGMYYMFYRLSASTANDPGPRGWSVFDNGFRYIAVFYFYLVLAALLLFFAIRTATKKKYNLKKSLLMYFCIILSAPFLGSGFMVGNSILLVISMLLLALYLRNSESSFLREAALLLIAASAGFKLYPAVFGLLYLKEHRWKEAVRLIIYGVLLFTVPFIWFGGVEGAINWMHNLMDVAGLLNYGRVQFIKGVAYMALVHLCGSFDAPAVMIGIKVIPLVFLLLMILLGWRSED